MPDNSDPRTPGHQPEGPASSGWQVPHDQQAGGVPPYPGWGAAPPPAGPPPTQWRTPDVKPGVIPLRPLGAGEIVDGAITTVRKNPMATLGLAAIVGTVTALISLLGTWIVTQQDALFDPTATDDEILDAVASTLPVLGIEYLLLWLATTFLTGLLTIVVGQAVIGRQVSIGTAWSKARPRMWRLLGLTLLYTLIWVGAFVGVIIATAVLAVAADAPALVLLGILGAGVLGIWLYVRFALAVPSLMLESESAGAVTGQVTRAVGVGRALGRSARLVTGSWWRTFGVLLLITIIYAIVSWAVNIPFQTVANAGIFLSDPESIADLGFGAYVMISIGQIVATAIAAPFMAAATVLLYIDLRIRREGLDLQLARSAGVTMPGHEQGGYGASVQQPWTTAYPPQPGYQQPPPGYQQPPPGYQQSPPGYQQSPPGYQQPPPGYQQPPPNDQQPPPGPPPPQ